VAVVVWVFAGGGESEIRGLLPFLQSTFNCTFERKTPIRQKPGPKPTVGQGHTGKSLAEQIKIQLPIALRYGACDLVLVFDDLDCRDAQAQETFFQQTIDAIPGTATLPKFIAFAAPELEAWIIADWDNTIAKNVDFRAVQQGLRQTLSTQYAIPFASPEAFSTFNVDKGSCQEKLSECLIEAALEQRIRYAKGTHTPAFIRQLDPDVVSQKCPLFRPMFTYLTDFCTL
jgi:hypothetical protein